MLTALRLGMDFALGCPEGYMPNPDVVAQAEGLAAVSGASLADHARPGARRWTGAHAVYTDVWASMGQEQEAVKRKQAFRAYQVNDALFALARPDAIFMHCLPAKRGEEVTDGVMESRALGGVRPGGKPPARAESAAADDADLGTPIRSILRTFMSKTEESGARLLGRAGYLRHHSVAEGKLRLRSGRGMRRYRAGRR